MQAAELPEDVQKLLRDYIESYEQLELLLLLRGERAACWTEEALSARLGIRGSLLLDAMARLRSAGFLTSVPQNNGNGCTYRVQSEEAEATIERLARAYKDQPMPVIKLMSANAIERVRTAALRTFADAFLIRKDKKDG